MSRFRFSIKYLLAAVALIAGGCAALTNHSVVWAYVVCIVFGALLLFSPVVAIYGRGSPRRFAGGFSLATWLYVLLVMWSFPTANIPGLHSAVTGLTTIIAQQAFGTVSTVSAPPTLVQPPVASVQTATTGLDLNGDKVADVPATATIEAPTIVATPTLDPPADFNFEDPSVFTNTIQPPRVGFPVDASNYPWESSPDYSIVNGTLVTDPRGLNYLLVVGHALAAIAIGFLAGNLAVVLAPADKESTAT